jgi:NAD+-dependent secondary alcohol dehydrogenase Adh1
VREGLCRGESDQLGGSERADAVLTLAPVDERWAMTRRAGSDFVIGYGGAVGIPTIDVTSTERNVVRNLVGSYDDPVELMALKAAGRLAS